jgi:hypothetical protein
MSASCNSTVEEGNTKEKTSSHPYEVYGDKHRSAADALQARMLPTAAALPVTDHHALLDPFLHFRSSYSHAEPVSALLKHTAR